MFFGGQTFFLFLLTATLGERTRAPQHPQAREHTLHPPTPARAPQHLHPHTHILCFFSCFSPQEVTSSEEVLDLLRQGNANRRTEATGANQVSSRSHAVLQVVVTRTVEGGVSGSKSVRESKLSLIDLAG